MAQDNFAASDPLSMLRTMWSNMGINLPSMVTPTLDCNELDKRISDLKVIEGWLSMNLSMLQITIKSLEMQTSTLRSVQSMGEMASNAAEKVAMPMQGIGAATQAAAGKATSTDPQLWPLMLMQQLQEYTRRQAEAATEAKEEIKARTSTPSEESSGRKKGNK